MLDFLLSRWDNTRKRLRVAWREYANDLARNLSWSTVLTFLLCLWAGWLLHVGYTWLEVWLG